MADVNFRPQIHDLTGDDTRPGRQHRSGYIELGAKRAFDVAATLLLAPIALVIVGLIAAAIRLSGGTAFYGQPRLGKDGKVFTLWKLRSMVPNADKRLEEHLRSDPTARVEWDRTQKLRSDPRITPIGWYLRKYSLDELPQLWNVFVGDMSLVGPRPMFPEQRQRYPGTAYFDMRPGITGLWQISERNGCSFAERALHDTKYASVMSFRADIWILVMTVAVVIRGTGL
ncbi:sugar transferase [Aminobacter sp. AP02]|uniref:sugar transferase n=1 Tax=Aminobacter sp. AP02 TaxID=2135737 RepID=UPI000D6C14B4|nr:sugar transferase [Aminobacter sp. AP02]PWK76860.1 lipopolysaccharide/colanic/teichoic acid biosynthesis glycosyltransferase [Aminobacter sp. AP02]